MEKSIFYLNGLTDDDVLKMCNFLGRPVYLLPHCKLVQLTQLKISQYN